MKALVFGLRRWLGNVRIGDPVERRMASLVQVILLGLIAIILIATVINLLFAPGTTWQEILLRTAIFIFPIGFPLALLRRGYFRGSVFFIVAFFVILGTFAVRALSLRDTAETLLFFTLAIILAGLILGRRALAIIFFISAGIVIISAFDEQSTEVQFASTAIAGNFVLLNGLIALFIDQFGITLRSALTSSLRRELEYRSLAENIPDIVARFDSQLRYIYINDGIEEITGVPAQSFIGKTNVELFTENQLIAVWESSLRQVFESGTPKTIEFEYPSITGLRLFESRLVPELDPLGRVESVLSIARDITQRRQADLQIRQQIERLTALSQIDQAIVSSFDLKVTLDILVSQVIGQLNVDAVDVLLLTPHGEILEHAASRGFQTPEIETTHVHIGESYAGQVARAHRMIHMENLHNQTKDPLLIRLITEEKFISYWGVPLIAKGKVIGVLEIFSRTFLQRSPQWFDFLNTLAGQAAIAIENATLFENLERSNRELFQAYDATIEGWSRAMDLRDKETEGHTQRVTRMTLELCRAMKIGEEQLLHIRRGALLHDIGKLGIPDHILLKAETLTDEEWEIMRKHPQFAYEMLSSIKYLEPALKIPYCHHERWDGTGYPRGLKGQQIPLEARIFAVVDVWDALRSDRPYRPAWDVESARNYVQEHTGSHFDPMVVEYFLKTIN